MRIQLLCPYLPAEAAVTLDRLLTGLHGDDRADKLQQLVFHLQNNPELGRDPGALFQMSDQELAKTVKRADQRESMTQAYQLLVDGKKGEGGMRCDSCGGRDVESSLKQIRGADEGMTVFCVCQNRACQARWTLS